MYMIGVCSRQEKEKKIKGSRCVVCLWKTKADQCCWSRLSKAESSGEEVKVMEGKDYIGSCRSLQTIEEV